jgi:TRAP-type mannitol/chloroaromatic compound transport system permease large subunit
MMVLLAGGIWIAVTLAICGWVGQAFFAATQPGKNLFAAFWESNASWELAALPLFIWMGEILFRTKLSQEMFEGLRPWLNRVPGRLMHTTILGCGIFGSVSGSSAATCATIAKVALPELKKRGYDEKLALGSLATADPWQPPVPWEFSYRRRSPWWCMPLPPTRRSSGCSWRGSCLR